MTVRRPTRPTRPAALRAVLALALAAGLAACGAPRDSSSGTAGGASAGATGSAACDKASLRTVTAGTLTVATDKPVYEPWFSGDDPTNGKGFESAVAYAVAAKLGYDKAEVTWTRVPFDSVVTPGTKAFDLDFNEFSITDERKKAVDFSSGYYDVRQAVVTYQGSPIAGATSVAALASSRLGAQVGTTSLTAITDQVKPSSAPMVYNTNDLAVQALKNKQIDGLVVDLPTAFYVVSAQLDGGVIVGQLPAAGGTPEQFGAVLAKGSPLTACVSSAVDALRADGTLGRLETQWLAGQGAPELK
ncbi:ABC transporter substrate-binding protein [Lapillicoccus jejuensis]|uniref:Polar amino acid transport system substrate-binding protein n=1 Tax=Lapillicoccus jejuensis TaxID=402171 RepID=A0A542DXG4_9MICO|nr:ABC transporter substrate-binding protein [Lapillicoccus jejuensis]TQJ07778.1 polar amino acid transport system substrate-binding protein [Lapillicoccus jejuensis]